MVGDLEYYLGYSSLSGPIHVTSNIIIQINQHQFGETNRSETVEETVLNPHATCLCGSRNTWSMEYVWQDLIDGSMEYAPEVATASGVGQVFTAVAKVRPKKPWMSQKNMLCSRVQQNCTIRIINAYWNSNSLMVKKALTQAFMFKNRA